MLNINTTDIPSPTKYCQLAMYAERTVIFTVSTQRTQATNSKFHNIMTKWMNACAIKVNSNRREFIRNKGRCKPKRLHHLVITTIYQESIKPQPIAEQKPNYIVPACTQSQDRTSAC